MALHPPTPPICLHLEPVDLAAFRDDPDVLLARWAGFWGSRTDPMRLISRTRRFSYAPFRQRLRQQLTPLDDVRTLVQALLTAQETDDPTPLASLAALRLDSLRRATQTHRDAPAVQRAVERLAAGATDAATLQTAREGLLMALWPWRWRKNYRRMYEVIEAQGAPLAIDHQLLIWPEQPTNPQALAATVQQAFLLPTVQVAPLPPLATGRYQVLPTLLRPEEPGQPWLRVLHAWDVRGTWDVLSLRTLLMQDMELAVSIDVTTLNRTRAQRAVQDSHTVLTEAVYGRYAVKDATAERALGDVTYALAQLDTQQVHEVAYTVLLQAPSEADLDEQTQQLRDLMGARLRLDVLAGAQGEYFKFFTPTPAKAIDAPVIRRNALSENLATKTPWAIRKRKAVRGVSWGFDPFEETFVHYDLFGPTGTDNPHLLMLGKAGSGKTVTLLTLALRHAVAGHQIIVFDPVGNCQRLADAVGSGAAAYHLTEQVAINVLDPLDPAMSRQLSHVARRLSMILGRAIQRGSGVRLEARVLSNIELGLLDTALQHPQVYGPDGLHLPAMTPATAPLLADLVAALAASPEPEAQALGREIALVALQSRAAIFNAPTTLRWDFGADVVTYNLNNADPALLPMYLDTGFAAMNQYVRSPARRQRGQKVILIIDEFGILSQVESLKEEVARATKEWRNYGAAMWSCDQNGATYMGGSGDASDFANLTANNTAVKLVGRQEGTDARLLEDAFAAILGPAEGQAMRTAGAGEFLGIFGAQNDLHHLRVQLTDLETAYFIRKG